MNTDGSQRQVPHESIVKDTLPVRLRLNLELVEEQAQARSKLCLHSSVFACSDFVLASVLGSSGSKSVLFLHLLLVKIPSTQPWGDSPTVVRPARPTR